MRLRLFTAILFVTALSLGIYASYLRSTVFDMQATFQELAGLNDGGLVLRLATMPEQESVASIEPCR